MKLTRRQFGKMATASAAGLATVSLVAPGSAMAQTNMFEGSLDQFSVTPPEDGKNWHPLAAQRPHNDILSRLQGIMQREGFDVLILIQPENILYSTGYFSKFAYAPGIPAGAQTAAVIPAEGKAHLVVSLYEKDDAPRQTIDVEYESVAGFVFVDDGTAESRAERDAVLDPALTIKAAVKIAQDYLDPDGKIGIEAGMLLAGFKDYIDGQLNGTPLTDCSGLMYESRLIKFPWEVDMLRLAAQHAERFMMRAARELEPGMNAMGFDKIIQVAAWEEDKENSMSTLGYQTGIGPYWGIGLAPRNYVIQEGDVARIDGGGVHLGYISDISRTWVVGGSKPDQAHVDTYDALYAGFAKGLEMLAPGVKMKDLYAAIRAEVEKSSIIPVYPRGHMGHGISVAPTAEDVPKISANEETVFQPGMCISMECSYMAAEGAPAPGPYNIEDSFVITEDGYERFTMAPDSIFWNV
jgi:Xaa-Pro dipeptidase